MSVMSIALSVLPRRYLAGVTVGVLATSGVAVGVYFDAANAYSCSARHTYIEQGFDVGAPMQRGRVSNTCSGSHSPRVRVRHNDVFGRDDTIASAEFNISSGTQTYERSTQGCRGGKATYHSDQDI